MELVVLGPQALSLNEASFHDIYSKFPAWIIESLNALSDVLDSAAADGHMPALKDESLAKSLAALALGKPTFPLPNILLSPLVVADHLSQYTTFIKDRFPHLADNETIPLQAEALGLCTGTLSEAVVSLSPTLKDIEANGAKAIKLATLAGALVDTSESATSFSVSWHASTQDIDTIVSQFQDSYISVIVDRQRATVTCSNSIVSELRDALEAANMFTFDIALQGRFHWPKYDIIPLSKFAEAYLSFTRGSTAITSGTLTSQSSTTTAVLEQLALKSILIDKADWYAQIQSAVSESGVQITVFGPERCIPPTIARQLGNSISYFDVNNHLNNTDDERVAVIGMAVHTAGSKDLLGFWETVKAGVSQHREVPKERLSTMKTPWREPEAGRKWYGNFIDDYDCFDHKFFRKSPRESASMDPQHRLALQVAYQALEQAGYFSKDNDLHVGCYMGFGNSDYEEHAACHPANAFSATGVLKAFLPGRISHHFGWTGPSMTIDTACSSSSVAVHHACRAILDGDCSAALAGGSNLIMSPNMYHNLAGASFLSPTGQCKSFDISADGYCRGEAAGVVYLKKYSRAVADGDQIFGVIASSRVYQNQNCTAITVPNEPSLKSLFVDVLGRAKVKPQHISVVEAHGTGTQVGDPAEVSGIRSVFGGLQLGAEPLSLISSKGLVGHSETASGIVSLIKLLLMMNHGVIPPQASFVKLNPALNITTSDRIEVPTASKKWNQSFKAALINNYGASGSNASMVVTQPPSVTGHSDYSAPTKKVPFWFSGFDESSLKRYISQFRKFINSSSHSIDDLSYQLARQSNRTLPQALILNASSVDELDQKLATFERGEISSAPISIVPARPVILAFGGQVSTYVGLNKDVYPMLSSYIQTIDKLAVEQGFPSILPTAIFQTTPIEDIVQLQLCLFALQYASANAWMDSGAANKVAAVIGHSFGELTALCVSGIMSLHDTVAVIGGRATLIRDKWTAERGSMLAVEGSQADVDSLGLSIACYNTSTSFTLAGSSTEVEVALTKAHQIGIKAKRLNVTHAFHSAFADELLEHLNCLGATVKLNQPAIPIERSTADASPSMGDSFVADHLRNPVYFSHAVDRINTKYPDAVWIECGSNSTVTSMASQSVSCGRAHFQAVNITSDNTLCNATTQFWKHGLNLQFWSHRSSVQQRSAIILPAYQFDKSQHLLELTLPETQIQVVQQPQAVKSKEPTTLTSFDGIRASTAYFTVNTSTARYKENVSPHIMASTVSVCPGMYQLEVVLDAFMSFQGAFKTPSYVSEFQNVQYFNPIVLTNDIRVSIEMDSESSSGQWNWKIVSSDAAGGRQTQHAIGRLHIVQSQVQHAEITKLSRYGGRRRAEGLLSSSDDSHDILQGRNIYRAFSPVIDYKEHYRHLSKIVGKDYESAGRVNKTANKQYQVDTVLTDNFCQVAGIFVNLMTSKSDFTERGIFICNGIERWIRSPLTHNDKTWTVYAVHHLDDEANYISDVFAYGEQGLCEAVLGISYLKVAIPGIQRVLAQFTPSTGPNSASNAAPPAMTNGTSSASGWAPSSDAAAPPKKAAVVATNGITNGFTVNGNGFTSQPETATTTSAAKTQSKVPKIDIVGKCRDIICNLCGVEANEVENDSDLVELGIDSLMSMELTREVDAGFKVHLETDHLMAMTDFQSFVDCVRILIGDSGQEEEETTNGNTILPTVGGLTNGYTNGVMAVNGSSGYHHEAPNLSAELVRSAFSDIKARTDEFIVTGDLGTYYNEVMPRSTYICVAYCVDALEEMGSPIKSAQPGQVLQRVEYLPKHKQQIDLIYNLLATDAGIIDIRPDGTMTRTSIPLPSLPVDQMIDELVRDEPIHMAEHKLTRVIGPYYANCLRGKQEGIQLIFGTAEGKQLAAEVYAKSPINRIWITQAAAFIEQLFATLPKDGQPINILEMGAGTCGTTSQIIPLLERLGVPYKYTMTDLSSSLVAAARRRFRGNPNMEFTVLDIESEPAAKLLGSQHMILATNCVHATRKLRISCRNIEKILRPDGFLLLLEMTEQVPWVDFIFGLVEGWWLFEDDRNHALSPVEHWQKILGEVGFHYCDWTTGARPEANLQRLIIAQKYAAPISSSSSSFSTPPPSSSATIPPPSPLLSTVLIDTGRREQIDSFVHKYTHDFVPVHRHYSSTSYDQKEKTVLITGATGSLGSHLVAESITRNYKVICVNRPSVIDVVERQAAALERGGLSVDMHALKVIETDTSKPLLGLGIDEYESLAQSITHIIHNAWPMSLTRKVDAYESQFRVMRNLIDLAKEAGATVQFISSIGVVGKRSSLASEERVQVESVLDVGYPEAKLICERMLNQTLGPRAMAVRIGQIAGSTITGFWNTVEHFASVVKSAQTVGAWPDLQGTLAWLPVGDAASVLLDLIDTAPKHYEIYHIEGPRQPWPELSRIICTELGLGAMLPYRDWVERVRQNGGGFAENPAGQLIGFFESDFERMDCGGLILDTTNTSKHSKTLRQASMIDGQLIIKYMAYWRKVKHLD